MSLLDFANTNQTTAVDINRTASDLHSNREDANDRLDAADKAKKANAAGSALATGITVGLAASGPIGVAAGAGMLALGMLF